MTVLQDAFVVSICVVTTVSMYSLIRMKASLYLVGFQSPVVYGLTIVSIHVFHFNRQASGHVSNYRGLNTDVIWLTWPYFITSQVVFVIWVSWFPFIILMTH